MAVVFKRDPRDPAGWSGVPAGLVRELGELGIDVVPVSAEPSALLGRPARGVLAALEAARLRARGRSEPMAFVRQVIERSSELAILRTATVRWRLRGSPPLDGAVQLGSEYALPAGIPLVTYDDMTVAQAVRSPCWPAWQALRPGSACRRMRRQDRIYTRVRRACLSTPWAAESARSDYGVSGQRLAIVGTGRNVSPRPRPRGSSDARFLFVGSNWRLKNGARVLDAFAKVRDRLPRAELDVVGQHPRLDRPGVRGHGWLRLDDAGDRLRLRERFESATCLVMPSCQEASGIAYAEAAAAGVPSIGTSVGGASFIIGDGGRTVDPENEEALVAAMLELARPEVARRLGANALARSPLFTWRAVAERLLRALGLPGLPVDDLAEFL